VLTPSNASCNKIDNVFLKGTSMNRIQTFVFRAILGLVLSVLIAKMFFGKIDPVRVGFLAVLMVMMAYVTEYLRLRKKQ